MPDIELFVFGAGRADARISPQHYARHSNIRFFGKVEQDELAEHYASAAAVVFPSLVPETFGLTIVEAAACGTPAIVAKSSGGAAELVSTTGGGLLYQGDEELAAAIRQLVEDRPLRDELGARARAGYRAALHKGTAPRRLLEPDRRHPAGQELRCGRCSLSIRSTTCRDRCPIRRRAWSAARCAGRSQAAGPEPGRASRRSDRSGCCADVRRRNLDRLQRGNADPRRAPGSSPRVRHYESGRRATIAGPGSLRMQRRSS